MKTSMTSPCPECPFRTDVVPYLRRARIKALQEDLVDNQRSFTCHKTLKWVTDEGLESTPESQHCAGAMILLEKLEKPNQWMRWMERLGRYDHTKLDMDAPVFDTFEAMADAQRS